MLAARSAPMRPAGPGEAGERGGPAHARPPQRPDRRGRRPRRTPPTARPRMAHRHDRRAATGGNRRRSGRARGRPGDAGDRRAGPDHPRRHRGRGVPLGRQRLRPGRGRRGGGVAGQPQHGLPGRAGPEQVVPIVPAACLFDLYVAARHARRPDASWGVAAARAASSRALAQGCVGAGTGARIGGGGAVVLKGGTGSASVVAADGTVVAALVAANPSGGVVDPRTGVLHGLDVGLPGEWGDLRRPSRRDVAAATGGGAHRGRGPRQATVLAVVATDATLTRAEATRLAFAGHDGMARAVRPSHAMTDGDVVFSLATGARALVEADPSDGPEVGVVAPRSARRVDGPRRRRGHPCRGPRRARGHRRRRAALLPGGLSLGGDPLGP